MNAASQPAYSIECSQARQSPEHDQICAWLRDYNWQSNQSFMDLATHDPQFESPLLLVAKQQGQVVGGLIADQRLTWLRISIMAVDPQYRRRGIGRQLLTEAERWAKQHACRYLYVDTMQYQSPEFYQLAGFQIVGELPDWDSHGHTKFFLMKTI
ncbi:GNAT family N-acetyltransferase [Blastopirellula marina]|uniref:N-acetyltransferase domain-containing protein n=1 Tax=Blastopirellula marina TaxID=124 RepID=A0A2S8FLK9_9BACT|nr:GNAT family N-acetyltransferase [Blastopirellula marina]PQO33068.1 hypothetical protein C5Y98_18200 [Blastopirellula marina]PTL43235.1 N-acetyltransferase [Blastopirellula marina]